MRASVCASCRSSLIEEFKAASRCTVVTPSCGQHCIERTVEVRGRIIQRDFTSIAGWQWHRLIWLTRGPKNPDFEPAQRAFYYARVIEIPTPRWTAYETVRFGTQISDDVEMTTQERAYTSPIWYTPAD